MKREMVLLKLKEFFRLPPFSRKHVLRLALGVLGIVGIGIGILGLPTELEVSQLIGLISWLAASLVLHDGILVPLSHLFGFGLRRFSYGLRPESAVVIRTALLIGAVLTLVGLPLLRAQQVAKNVSVLQGDYLLSLILFWAGLILSGAITVFVIERQAQRARTSGAVSEADASSAA